MIKHYCNCDCPQYPTGKVPCCKECDMVNVCDIRCYKLPSECNNVLEADEEVNDTISS